MILNFDRGYGQSAEQMVQSLMESTQLAFDTLERKLGLSGDFLIDDDGNVITDKIEANNLAVKGELALGTALSIANGGTGATTAAGAMANFGVADYIVEQGTSGIWTYEKWNSGTIKCWTTNYWSTPTLTMSAISSSGTYKSNAVSMPFPSDLFVNVDEYFNAQFSFRSAGTYLQSIMYTVPSGSVLPIVILKGGSSTASVGVSAFVIGRWK